MKMETRSRAIDKIYKRRDRIEMPDFQREQVWSQKKKILLIDSLLRGWHLPKFYFCNLDEGNFDCVDGQQRLVAIFEFFDDVLVLDDEMTKIFGGSKYSELPDQLSDEFDDQVIDIEEIEDASDEELEELFRRLQLGTPLNTAEKLNATSGNMRNFCHEVAAHDFFAKKIKLRNARYAHFQVITMWCFLESRGIQTQIGLPQLEGFIRENRTFSKKSDLSKRILETLDFFDKAFPEDCKYIRNRANTLSICMLASRVVPQIKSADAANEFGEFVERFFKKLAIEVEKGVAATDKELLSYQQAITSGSAGGKSIKTRINILTRRLAEYSPTFSSLIGAYKEVEDDTVRRINDISTIAKEKILIKNRSQKASTGEDLFSMTTKAVGSLDLMSKPIRDINAYGKFIDALFFIVYEGTGNCKRLNDPIPSFPFDIKFLRGALRHDLDHGKEKDKAKKAKRNSIIFRKYSGKETPDECGPEDFLSAQNNILNTMVEFLDGLV